MSSIDKVKNPWRDLLKTQASFRDVMFHVESGTPMGGRRTVTFEYPKKNDPYSEDMGRHAKRFSITGYLVYKPLSGGETDTRYDYVKQRDRLMKALDEDGPGKLVHPVFAKSGIQVMCERWSMTETRERGGYTEFSMQFVERGKPGNSIAQTNTSSNVDSQAGSVEVSAKSNIDGAVPLPTPRPVQALG